MRRANLTLIGREIGPGSGAGNVMYEIARRARSDFQVDSIVCHQSSNLPTPIPTTVTYMPRRPSWAQAPVGALANSLRTRRPSYIRHAHDTYAFSADIYTAHSCFPQYLNARRQEWSKRKRFASRLYPPHVSLEVMSRATLGRRGPILTTVSESVRQEFLRQYDLDESQVVTIYNGVDLERFGPVPEKSRMSTRASLGLGDTAIVGIFVGHEFDRKRLGSAIYGVSQAAKDADVHLLVVGDGEVAKFKSMAVSLGVSERVQFLGRRADVPALLAASDIFVFPTEYEAASLAILEAAATGLAVVTTAVAMASEAFQHERDAWLLPNRDDPGGVADALSRLARQPRLREALGAGAMRTAALFSWDAAYKQYANLYLQVLEQKRLCGLSERP